MISKNVQMCFYLGIKSSCGCILTSILQPESLVSHFIIKELWSFQATGDPF